MMGLLPWGGMFGGEGNSQGGLPGGRGTWTEAARSIMGTPCPEGGTGSLKMGSSLVWWLQLNKENINLKTNKQTTPKGKALATRSEVEGKNRGRASREERLST